MALDVERAAEPGSALTHRVETEMTRKGASGVEADTIVVDLQPHLRVDLAEDEANLCRPRVPARIVQRLLGDAVEGLLAFPAHHGLATKRFLDRDPVPDAKDRGVVLERAGEPFAFEGLGAQLENQRPHLCQRRLRKTKDIFERLLHLGRILGQQLLGGPRPERDAVDGLRYRIMKVASEPLALLERNLLPRRAEQARIIDG